MSNNQQGSLIGRWIWLCNVEERYSHSFIVKITKHTANGSIEGKYIGVMNSEDAAPQNMITNVYVSGTIKNSMLNLLRKDDSGYWCKITGNMSSYTIPAKWFDSKNVQGTVLMVKMNALIAKYDDAKCNECNGLKKEVTKLQAVVIDLSENKNKNKLLQQELEQKNIAYKHEVLKLQQKNKELQTQNVALNDECKEIKMEFNDLKSKYNELKKNIKLDVKDFMNWSGDDVVDWIMSIEDGRYHKYEDKLRKVFEETQIDGTCLPDIEKSDIAEWGITHFKDKTGIFKQIKSNFQEKIPDQNKTDHDVEGVNKTAYI